jgi:ribosome-binding factor A
VVIEILAEQLARSDDDRLEGVSLTGVEVDADLSRALVFYDSAAGAEGDDSVLEALEEHRARLQAAVNRETTMRRTPTLVFRPDPAIRSAARIEEILHEIHRDEPEPLDDADGG